MGTRFTKFSLSAHKVSVIFNTNFPPLHEMLYAGRVKLFAEASELFTHAIFYLMFVSRTASSERIFQGTKTSEVENMVHLLLWPNS